MLLLEEYIAQRKKEDGINDRDISARYNNAKICSGYVLDYYTTYLDSIPEDKETLLQMENMRNIENSWKSRVPTYRTGWFRYISIMEIC